MTSNGSAPDIVFRGIDGNEAEEFIAAIEDLAFTEGWSEDNKRMLLFARSRLRQGAVRWFARLDPSKKKDWDLFVEALLEQYPQVQAPAEPEISTPVWSATTFSPSASTAILPSDQILEPEASMRRGEGREAGSEARHSALPRSRAYDPSALARQVGVLRVVAENGTTCPQYIWRGRRPIYSAYNGSISHPQYVELSITIDRQEALVVSFIPEPEPHPIGCLNATYAFVDFCLYVNPWGDGTGTVCASSGAGPISRDARSSFNFSNIWNVSSDGSLEASLTAYDPSSHDSYRGYTRLEDFKTSEVLLDNSGTSIRFVKPGTPLRQDAGTQFHRRDFKARIVFEPF